MRKLLALTLLAFPLFGHAQNYDSTGTNRLFVQAKVLGGEPIDVPGYGKFQDGAVVSSGGAEYSYITTYWVCVVKKGALGGTPIPNYLYQACPPNTTYFITGSGVYHDGGSNGTGG